MMQVIFSLVLIALGIGVDAVYQRIIRIAECNAYETGYQQGKKEEQIWQAAASKEQHFDVVEQVPSMAAPISMPPTFEERMKKHGQATIWINK
jgi:hypothetical protein